MTKQYKFIAEHITEEDILCQIAEEAAELAHAAMKLRRAKSGTNPTPVDSATAIYNILEEFADVYVARRVFQIKCTDLVACQPIIDSITDTKTERWIKRLKEKQEATK